MIFTLLALKTRMATFISSEALGNKIFTEYMLIDQLNLYNIIRHLL